MTAPDQPGWYDDPSDSNAQRYWDGQNWTPHRQRKPISRPTRAPVTPAPAPLPPNLPPPSSPMASNLPPAYPPPTYNLPPAYPPPAPNLPPPPTQQAQWPSPFPMPVGLPQRTSRVPIVLIAVAAVIVFLAVAGVLAYKFVFKGSSDEDQIRKLVQSATTDENSANGPGLTALVCSTARGTTASSEELRDSVNEDGTYATSVTDLHVTGDRATATIVTTRSKSPNDKTTEPAQFVKENGSWKLCPSQ